MRSPTLFVQFVFCVSAIAAADGISTVVPRGGGAPFERQVESVSEAGVVIVDGGTRTILSLDSVKEIRGEGAAAFAPYADLAERVWRARIRLERSDIVGAEPLLEDCAPLFSMMAGPTAAVVHVGLMRCRIERNARTGAIVPWLNAVAAGDCTDHATSILRSDRQDGLLIDRETGVAPAIPPIFSDGPAVRGLAKSNWPHLGVTVDDREDARRAARLSEWYYAAVCFETGRPFELPEVSGTSDSGLLLVRDIVLSRVGDPNRRTAARASLKAKSQESQSAWIRVWSKVAIGRSLTMESEIDLRLIGVGLMLEVVAADAQVLPELTGVCLAEAAETLEALGDVRGAEKLRAELERVYPNSVSSDRHEKSSEDAGASGSRSDR